MPPSDRWASQQGVRLHYLDSGLEADPGLTPLVCVPGSLGSAEDYRTEIDALAPRRVIAMSLRGRGQSDAPAAGYRFIDHVRDVEAIIDAAGVEDFCLLGHSLGVPFALGYAALHPSRAVGIIVGDYPARYPSISPEWVTQKGQQLGSRAPWEVLAAIQRDSAEVLLWDELGEISAPVLLLRGDQPDSRLKPEDVQLYLAHLDQAMAVVFPGSGHALWEPDINRYLGTLRLFLEGIDGNVRAG